MAVSRGDLPTLEIRITRVGDAYSVELRLGEREFPRGTLGPELLHQGAADDRGARLFARFTADEPIRMAWNLAAALHPQRRIRLRLDDLAPALHTLPWEALTDTSPTATARTLAADRDTPFSRHVATAGDPPPALAALPIKLLSAVAAPADIADYDLPPLDRAAEIACIAEAVAAAPPGLALHTHLAGPCTLAALEAELEKGYHVLHLLAHGAVRRDGAAATFFEAADGNTDRVDGARFAAMIDRLTPTLRLVVLMSCQSATRSPTDARAGLAPQLLAAGVPAVLAMQDLVPVDTARAFTLAFYRELWTTGEVDRAANRARAVVLTARLPGDAIPVLASAPGSHRLWLPDAAPAPAPAPASKPVATASWHKFGGPFLDVALAREHDGRLTLAAVDADHRLVARSQRSPDGAWGPWTKIEEGVRRVRIVTDPRGRLAVFSLDDDGAVRCGVQDGPAGAWGEWIELGGEFTNIFPGVYDDGILVAFATAADGTIHERNQKRPGGDWYDWTEQGGRADQLTAVLGPDGTVNLFAILGDRLLHSHETDDEDWIDWYEFADATRRVVPVTTRAGAFHLLAVGDDGVLWHCKHREDYDWTEWHRLGGRTVDLAVAEHDGGLEVLTADRHGVAWTLQLTDRGWGEWTRLGPAKPDPDAPAFVRVLLARTTADTTRKFALDRAGVLHFWTDSRTKPA